MPAKKKQTKKSPARKSLGFVQGKNIASTMLRVDLEFAEYVRQVAKDNDIKVTEATRMILEAVR